MRFGSLSEVLECRTLNLSRGGVFIATATPRAEGTAVRLKLQFGRRLLDVGGVVVRCIGPRTVGQTPGMGIMFTNIEPAQAAMIGALVDLSG